MNGRKYVKPVIDNGESGVCPRWKVNKETRMERMGEMGCSF